MLAGAHADADAAGDIDWLVSVDSTIVRAHQHAAGAAKGGSRKRTFRITPSADPRRTDHGAGRTLAFVITGGNVNDCTRLQQVMDAINVARHGPGRARSRPDHVIADKTSHAVWLSSG